MVFAKLIFAYLGYRTFGGQGALIGLIIGHAIDAGLAMQLRRKRYEKRVERTAKIQHDVATIEALIGMLVTFAKMDGNFCREEKEVIHQLLDEILSLTRHGRKLVDQSFQSALRSNRSFQSYSAHFADIMGPDPGIARFSLYALDRLAKADGPYTAHEIQCLRFTRELFRPLLPELDGEGEIPMSEQKPAIEDRIAAAYKTLGCSTEDSAETLKRRYRELAREYHPDTIVSKELPEDFITFANERFRSIQEAYAFLKKERGLA